MNFGLVGYVCGEDRKRRKLHVLIVTLPMSRYQFVWPTFLQTTDGAHRWTRCCLGGVAHRVVLDNMTAAVARASAKDCTTSRATQRTSLITDCAPPQTVALDRRQLTLRTRDPQIWPPLSRKPLLYPSGKNL